jgi:hypothetical protein
VLILFSNSKIVQVEFSCSLERNYVYTSDVINFFVRRCWCRRIVLRLELVREMRQSVASVAVWACAAGIPINGGGGGKALNAKTFLAEAFNLRYVTKSVFNRIDWNDSLSQLSKLLQKHFLMWRQFFSGTKNFKRKWRKLSCVTIVCKS